MLFNKENKDWIKETLIYWMKQIFKNVCFILFLIILGLIILSVNNPYGRYLDSWLE